MVKSLRTESIFSFCQVFDLIPRVGWIIAHDMGDTSIANKMKEMLKLRPTEPEVAVSFKCCLDIYDVCRLNRNSLTHFTAKIPSADPASLADVTFVRMKGPSAKPNPLPSSLADIRRVAFEIQALSIYLWNVHKALVALRQGQPASLPPLVAVPELLWTSPPPTAPKD